MTVQADPRPDIRVCVCGHVGAHHSRSMRNNCTWTGCGCPKFVQNRKGWGW